MLIEEALVNIFNILKIEIIRLNFLTFPAY